MQFVSVADPAPATSESQNPTPAFLASDPYVALGWIAHIAIWNCRDCVQNLSLYLTQGPRSTRSGEFRVRSG